MKRNEKIDNHNNSSLTSNIDHFVFNLQNVDQTPRER